MIDPSAAPMPQGGPSPMGMPDLPTAPIPFNGAKLPVQGPDPKVVTIDQVMALLRDDRLRGFRIDVETDSLIEADQQAEKQQRTEFVQSVGEFIAKVGPIAQAMPPLAPLVGGLLQFAVRGFKVGQELEELIETTMHKAGMLLENPPPKPPPPEEMAKIEGIKAKTQAEIQKAQMEMQTAQIEAQGKVQAMQADMQAAQTKHQTELAALAQKHDTTMAQMSTQIDHDRERHQMAMAEHGAKMQQMQESHSHQMNSAQQSHQMALEGKHTDIEGKKQAASAKASKGEATAKKADKEDSVAAALKALHEHISAPKKVVRDASGRVVGIENVKTKG